MNKAQNIVISLLEYAIDYSALGYAKKNPGLQLISGEESECIKHKSFELTFSKSDTTKIFTRLYKESEKILKAMVKEGATKYCCQNTGWKCGKKSYGTFAVLVFPYMTNGMVMPFLFDITHTIESINMQKIILEIHYC